MKKVISKVLLQIILITAFSAIVSLIICVLLPFEKSDVFLIVFSLLFGPYLLNQKSLSKKQKTITAIIILFLCEMYLYISSGLCTELAILAVIWIIFIVVNAFNLFSSSSK